MLELPESTEREMLRLKAYFPARVVWCAHRNGEWQTGATLDNRVPNQLAREGWQVFKMTGVKTN